MLLAVRRYQRKIKLEQDQLQDEWKREQELNDDFDKFKEIYYSAKKNLKNTGKIFNELLSSKDNESKFRSTLKRYN